MPNYTVSWHIDLSADTVVLAATEARDIHRDPTCLATAFNICDEHGIRYLVDLDDESPASLTLTAPPRRSLMAGHRLGQRWARRIRRRAKALNRLPHPTGADPTI